MRPVLSNTIIQALYPVFHWVRRHFVKAVRPVATYRLAPISDKFGFDRGTPIDRLYIEDFLEKNSDVIQGRVLEINTDMYTKKYGRNISHSDILDINPACKRATIHADLRNPTCVGDNSYDCLIITHTIGMIDDHEAAIKNLYRILKPKGTLLLTGSGINAFHPDNQGYWKYTTLSFTYLLQRYFSPENILVDSYGNALAGQAFWVGMAVEDIGRDKLLVKDARYPVVITARATK